MAENDIDNEILEIPTSQSLNILYTSDIKGQAEQMAYLATLVRQIKSQESFTLLLDAGNWAKGGALCDKFKGMPMVEIFNSIGYDAAGVGEGEIAFGDKNLYAMEELANFSLLSCNLIEEKSGLSPYFLKPYLVIEKGPFSVAVIGISPPGNRHTGLIGDDFDSHLVEIYESLKQCNTNLVVVLSRLGLKGDHELAKKYPWINVIIGGVDGKFLENPEMEGETYICHPGEKAQYLGSLKLEMEAILRVGPPEK